MSLLQRNLISQSGNAKQSSTRRKKHYSNTSENCTKNAPRLHRRGASFFVQLHQKEGAEMYDNEWVVDLMLDDDLFPVEDDEDVD